MERDKSKWVQADFNGLFGRVLLCLSHEDFCTDHEGNRVELRAGMILTAFDENYEDGQRDDLFVSGVVEPSPERLACRGSRWVLRVDEDGLRWESDLLR
jgi:hypothetical protein